MCKWCQRGGLGVLPQKIFGFNSVKSCNFRHGNGTFVKARDSMYDRRRDNPLTLEVIRIFLNIYTLYNTGERSEQEKDIKIRQKQPFDPSPTHQISTQDPTPEKSQGRGGVQSPLLIRTCRLCHIGHGFLKLALYYTTQR